VPESTRRCEICLLLQSSVINQTEPHRSGTLIVISRVTQARLAEAERAGASSLRTALPNMRPKPNPKKEGCGPVRAPSSSVAGLNGSDNNCIKSGEHRRWHEEWNLTAERVPKEADEHLARNHRVSAGRIFMGHDIILRIGAFSAWHWRARFLN
jgi:hypothetical protein